MLQGRLDQLLGLFRHPRHYRLSLLECCRTSRFRSHVENIYSDRGVDIFHVRYQDWGVTTATARTNRSLAQLVDSERTPNLEDVLHGLDRCRPVRTSARCLNPDCNAACEWTHTRGRPSLFCSRSCHERFSRARDRLLADIQVIERVLAISAGSTEQQKRLRRELAHRRWILNRYPAPRDE